jgi:hypothetical protein
MSEIPDRADVLVVGADEALRLSCDVLGSVAVVAVTLAAVAAIRSAIDVLRDR